MILLTGDITLKTSTTNHHLLSNASVLEFSAFAQIQHGSYRWVLLHVLSNIEHLVVLKIKVICSGSAQTRVI